MENFFIFTPKGLMIMDLNFHNPYRNFKDFILYVDIVIKKYDIKIKSNLTEDHYKELRQSCLKNRTIDYRCVQKYIQSINKSIGYVTNKI